MIILVLVIQVLVYREVTALFNIPGRPSVTGSTRATSNASSRVSSAASGVGGRIASLARVVECKCCSVASSTHVL